MEKETTIYIHGKRWIDAYELIHLLQPHHINCVVDCRPLQNSQIGRNTPAEELKSILQLHQISYIPFFQHFGCYPSETRNKQGNVLYRRATSSPLFLQGVERIRNGVQKGYKICIIAEVANFYKSNLFCIVSKFLQETYNIIHLFTNGHYYSHQEVMQQMADNAQKQQQRNLQKRFLGQRGEEIAALYLSRQGYQILDHNWNLHHGCELDIVARKDNTLHFIEVKTRSSDEHGEPQQAITHKKMLHIINAIHGYCYRHGLQHVNSQIDSIAIIYHSDDNYDLKHFLGIRTDHQACADVFTFSQKPSTPSTIRT